MVRQCAKPSRIAPVLDAARPGAFLNFNLNARFASMRTELATIEGDTASLIRAMESSSQQSDEVHCSMGMKAVAQRL
jgi:hypothetical protein